MLGDEQVGLVTQDAVERVGAFRVGRRDHRGVEGRVLVRDVGIGGQALPAGEVAGPVLRGQRLALDREPLPVGGGQGAGAERPGHRQPVLVADDRGVGRLQRLGAEVPLGGPGQHVVGNPQDSAIAPRPMLVASAMITYSRFRYRSGGRVTLPPACTR